MNTTQARRLAETAMRNHGLISQGWVFQWDNARHRFGLCQYRYKTLSFSKFLTENSEEDEFMATVMHEIAHALVGAGHGHGIVWRRKMIELGQSPNRTKRSNSAQVEAKKATANYVVTCSVTGNVVAHMDRLVKQRTTKRGIIKYKGHQCKCHSAWVLYNGKSFQDA
jgi:predicted SprT family Zn-dependent metalloprotease